MSESPIEKLKNRTQLPAKTDGGATVQQFFTKNAGALAAVLPKHMHADRMVRIAMNAIRTTPRLAECSVQSLFSATLTCAQLGLEPNTPLGHAYLIPFNDTKKGVMNVNVIFGYKGLMDLARRSNQISSISSRVVRKGDDFSYQYGIREDLTHVPGDDDDAPITHVYATARLKDGGSVFEVMSIRELSKVKAKALAKLKPWQVANSPWTTSTEAMYRKTLVRRLFTWLPQSIEMAGAAMLDEIAEERAQPDLSGVLDGEYSLEESEGEETGAQDKAKQQAGTQAEAKQKPASDEKPKKPTRRKGPQETPQETPQQEDRWPKTFTDKETGETGWYDRSETYYSRDLYYWNNTTNMPDVDQYGCFVPIPDPAEDEPRAGRTGQAGRDNQAEKPRSGRSAQADRTVKTEPRQDEEPPLPDDLDYGPQFDDDDLPEIE